MIRGDRRDRVGGGWGGVKVEVGSGRGEGEGLRAAGVAEVGVVGQGGGGRDDIGPIDREGDEAVEVWKKKYCGALEEKLGF